MTESTTTGLTSGRPGTAPRQPAAAGSPFFSGLRLGSIRGIQIQVDLSLLIIFLLILFNLGAGVFPQWHPEWSVALSWGVALAAAILFFASVLLHELSHALVGRAQGIPISRITLFLFGGVAHMEGEPRSPKAEFLMAIVGPLTSIAIGIFATLIGGALVQNSLATAVVAPEQLLANMGPLATLLLWLGPINVLLGVFNMIPGFPLDGGRVLRSILWATTGDFVKATRWASGAGRGVAWTLMGLGVFNLFGGALLQGAWLLLIGWFLNNAARASYQQLMVRQALEDIPVSRVMRTSIARVQPNASVEAVVRTVFLVSDQESVPVESDGQLLGLVTLADVRAIPQERWAELSVAEIMTPVDRISALPPNAGAEQALKRLGEEQRDQIAVIDHGRMLGVVASRDVVKWLSFKGVTA